MPREEPLAGFLAAARPEGPHNPKSSALSRLPSITNLREGQGFCALTLPVRPRATRTPVLSSARSGHANVVHRRQGERFASEGAKGGYEAISVTQLAMVWWAYQSGLITKLVLRAYFGCWELETRRRLSGGKYQPSLAGLRKLVGGTARRGAGGLRPAVNRLLELGLLRSCSKAGITFAASPEELRHEDRSGLDRMLGELQGITRKVPVPRRIIRRLAGGLSKARTAVVIAHLIRCLFYRKAEGINAVGCCKASWIARVFGITERSVYDARSYLTLELGWLIPQDNSQRILNRDGLWVTVNLDWGPGEQSVAGSRVVPGAGQGRGTEHGTILQALGPKTRGIFQALVQRTRIPLRDLTTRNPPPGRRPPADPLVFKSRIRERKNPPSATSCPRTSATPAGCSSSTSRPSSRSS